MDTVTMATIGDLTWDGAFAAITARGIVRLVITVITAADTVYTDTVMAAAMAMVTGTITTATVTDMA